MSTNTNLKTTFVKKYIYNMKLNSQKQTTKTEIVKQINPAMYSEDVDYCG